MTFLTASPDDNEPRPGNPAGRVGPFVGIGLPQALAIALAGPRPIIMIDAGAIPVAGLNRLEDAEVGCLLLGWEVDALDVIAMLLAVGYRGAVTVVAPPLPDPAMVERELSRASRAITVTLAVR
ncbi:MAG: hypothetical protein ACK4HF_01165 [Paracoccaceae bacterium]